MEEQIAWVQPDIRVSRNESIYDRNPYRAWVCTLEYRWPTTHPLTYRHDIKEVFFGETHISAFNKAVVAMGAYLRSPEIAIPFLEGMFPNE